jgi:large conductance mechanosensitive channel
MPSKQSVMSFFDKFKQFALGGNMIDLALGVMIGAAFNKVISSLVKDVFMPPIGLMLGGIDFTQYKILLSKAIYNDQNNLVREAITLNVGSFLQEVFDFIIVAFVLFLVVQAMYTLRHMFEKQEEQKQQKSQEAFLKEIRNVLIDIRDQDQNQKNNA